ncbi:MULTISPECIES: extracellular solute-binding protein [Burkholderia]|uniref:extracellular solute-binding protein n=1 Tax=Burkholderia TaxID=32008 RepID=UPI000753DDB3|nr:MULTISPECIES: extracellular solute-binding protein [Burkholderia]AOJ73384.1 spermidine/putrescine ABC transporter substrate-binding protein [Burkholderia savannae]KVG43810.1 spermidine/putrescine ABC transporter substrate-binding protein [Burkholderia sp. MSMB0265]KVG84856.1 spermidine/putrescine ABC transporter substrate-binding protein [Burkholderia sp. MSMB2040]KVH00712.1 spermidine/putrescine ABC transporter substrate-binding protein [Burkholderia sp. MSMB2042]KVH00738.1 spermidine/putr
MKKIIGAMLLAVVGTTTAAELHVGSWPVIMPVALLKKFQAETGVETTLDTYASDAALTQKLQAGGGGYDVVIAGDYYVPVLVRSGLLLKLDKNRLPNMANIKPEYRHPSFDSDRNYAIPFTVVLTGFAYDSARVPGGRLDDSWKSLFEPPEALRGQIGDLDVEEELYMAASWYLGQDECTENPADAKRVLDVLQKQKPFVKTYSNDGTVDRLASRQITVQHVWNGAAVRAQERLPSIKFVYPKEGVRLFMDSLLIPAKARNVDSAYKFLNWMMQPENIALVTNAVRYNNEIIGSDRYVDAALLNNPAVKTPEQYKARLRPYKLCSPAAIQLRNKVWLKLKGNR